MSPVNIDFSERVRKLREQYRLTQTDMGRILGVSKTVISAYETGQYSPKHEILLKMANEFDVSMDALYGLPERTTVHYMNSGLDLTGVDPEQLIILEMIVKQFSLKNGS